MRMRTVRPLLALLAVAGLAACTAGPPAAPGGSGTGSAPPSSATQSASPTTGAQPTTLGPEDMTPDPSLSYPGTEVTPGQGNAELSILIMDSPAATPLSYTLVCRDGAPAAESKHPTAAAGCTALKSNPALLERKPKSVDQICTEQYGGPQTAQVTGAVDGVEVNVSYSLTNGCEISAWNAVRDILGSSGGAA
ncbi:subtilase-type protease inhibitor [Arthrobacter sp. CJ23]|uniref:subtilase-type protease inhibitor n=1 Tax=Arthrobacter sp. CJ23 TaxID=2972479 RepID=UPI00215C98BD|nr:subtilase-type protease inhibitor [Arthrobacter sp. CJ23]UVJ40093.1 subtilase-type protease inhibitor [Arthrobacter sp. CJ23]